MKKIIVVGAGIAGLTAAFYARRSGFDVTLIEQHSIAGGTNKPWNDTDALSDDSYVFQPDPSFRVEHDGEVLCLYRDTNKNVEQLYVISREGDSLSMSSRMMQTFVDMGGVLVLNSNVQKVNIIDGIVTGVTVDNEALDADAVIVTLETIDALDNLFDIPIDDKSLIELRTSVKPAICTFIGFGINAEIPETLKWELFESPNYVEQKITKFGFFIYSNDEAYTSTDATNYTTTLALISGRQAAQLVCKQFDVVFK